MKLKAKVLIGLNVALLVVAICVGFIAYRDANAGFDLALEMKADELYSLCCDPPGLQSRKSQGKWDITP